MKVVINKCYGGFSLSPEAELWLWEHGYRGEGFMEPVEEAYKSERDGPLGLKETLKKWREYLADKNKEGRRSLFITTFTPDEKFVLYGRYVPRDHPLLIKCIKALGEKANGACAKLKVVDVPKGVKWTIHEYDGLERVDEEHRSWG